VQSWRIIVDRSAYDQLVAHWEVRHGDRPAAAGDFFPAYRTPGPATA